MTLVDHSIALLVQHPRAQHPRPLPRRLVRVNLVPAAAAVITIIHGHVGEAVARVVAAIPVLGAPAAAPEASLGGSHTLAQDGIVDEAEVGRQVLGVFLVDDGYGRGGVVGEGAELAPVAGLLFVFETLGGVGQWE